MTKIILAGYIIVPAEDLESVKNALISHIKLTRAEPGCLLFNVTQDEKNAHKFDVYEEFTNQSAFDYHQSRTKASQWAKVSARVERHYQGLE